MATNVASTGRPTPDPIEERVLAAAARLFYASGISGVGVKEVCDAAHVSLNGLYARFPTKHRLVEAYLRRRNAAWLGSLSEHVYAARPGPSRLDALFDWLAAWFAEPGFNGCAFVNARGEEAVLDDGSRAVLDRHAVGLTEVLDGVAHGGLTTDELYVLVQGAIAAARTTQGPGAAEVTRAIAHARAG